MGNDPEKVESLSSHYRNEETLRKDPRRSLLQPSSTWEHQQKSLRASMMSSPLPQAPNPSQRTSTVSWNHQHLQQPSSQRNSTFSQPIISSKPTPRLYARGRPASDILHSSSPLDKTINSNILMSRALMIPTPQPGLPPEVDRSSKINSSNINWASHERLSWAERIDQAEAAQRLARHRRRMRRRLKDPSEREGLPLGIFGLAPPPALIDDRFGDGDSSPQSSSWSFMWKRRSSLSAKIGGSKRERSKSRSRSEQREEDIGSR
jgi:hypothetical protein